MHKQLKRVMVAGAALTCLVLMPGLAWALGLGQIQSDTHIGQPLKARIPILISRKSDLQGLSVGLAAHDAYKQAGLEEPDYLFTLKFEVKQGMGGPYVLITSRKPVKLPFLNLLVRARWMSGQVTRQYTLLLNPPVFASRKKSTEDAAPTQLPARSPTQPVASEPTPVRRPARSGPGSRPATTARLSRTGRPGATQTMPTTVQAQRYGPVERGETLWGIANRLRAGSGLTINQAMIAIYRANPQAFSGNINRLRAGAVLNVPAQSDIARISRRSATLEVADQNRSWQVAKASSGSQTGAGTVAGKIRTAQQAAEGASSQEAGGAGEVVLTAPRVTESSASGVGSGESGQTPSESGATAVAGAAVAAGGAGGPRGKSGNSNTKVSASSSGGPLKIDNADLAVLASNSANKEDEQTQTAVGQEEQGASGSPSANSFNSVNTTNGANTVGDNSIDGMISNWLTSPKGWIVIALIVLLLALLAFLLLRRRARDSWTADENADEQPLEAAEAWRLDEAATPATTSVVAAQDTQAHTVDDDTVSPEMEPDKTPHTEAGEHDAPRPDEPVQASPEDEAGEAALADALVEADFYAGNGDHAGAARSLGVALQHAPGRTDLRLRRLEELFAANERDMFFDEAGILHGHVSEASADWQTVAVMGRQLLPDEALFQDGSHPSAEESEESEEASSGDGDAPLDVDQELDRLIRTTPSSGLQDDFERTLGELSTMIETYMPEDGEIPEAFRSSLDEESSEPRPTALQEDMNPSPNDDDVLEFEPLTLPDEPVETPAGESSDTLSHEDETPDEAPDASQFNDVSIKLDLAQSYMEMGDNEAAREMLEEVLTGHDAAAREKALELLDGLGPDAAPESLDGMADVEGESETSSDSNAVSEATSDDDEARPGDESGTELDLARAYIEMGDQESARDVLEEVLDGDDEVQIKQARELLATLET